MKDLPEGVSLVGLEWANFEYYLAKWLEEKRLINDSITNTPDHTAMIRGEIHVLKTLLGLKPRYLDLQKGTK